MAASVPPAVYASAKVRSNTRTDMVILGRLQSRVETVDWGPQNVRNFSQCAAPQRALSGNGIVTRRAGAPRSRRPRLVQRTLPAFLILFENFGRICV
jgi:hypothetical protein